MTHIYRTNGDAPELMEESTLQPSEAITAYRDNHGHNSSNIIDMGYNVFTFVTTKGLFYARRAKAV